MAHDTTDAQPDLSAIDGLVAEPTAAAGDPQTPGPPAPSVTRAVPPKCPTRTRLYRDGELLDEGFPAEQLSERLRDDPHAVAWLDLYDPDQQDLQIVVDEFGLHPLSVEDAITSHQRAKVDRYRTHLFANMYAVSVDAAAMTITAGEIAVFITARALVTVRKDDFDIDTLIARWDLNADLVDAGNQVSALVYGLIDVVVDGHYHAVEQLDDAVDELQTHLFEAQTDVDVRRRAYELGASLAALRRVVAPMQEVVSRLNRADSHLRDDVLSPYYQDVYDHALRTVESVDAARDRVDRIADTQLNEQAAELNEITKRLAAWAAIIAVPTAVTGFYGQNVPYPGFGRTGGFIASCTIMLGLGALLYWYLRRNRWL
ncbi:magnesium transporter CorA family protein [Dactylosporangium matsuzakiense]|uniref:Magnesium transporter CorA n=1 Tax=Dactylosporangium matsuzakiense TaxID=53360 RepID=A0A9W6KV02_9ACTN|nr:magnesium transporter CorA family protein [Dactylosporangium matsuzakiense]UWZ48007.1 magnesium transporter CorA family protein [Dactylosporangium matsuzakiense]GLL07695.1 magnesium transporter CorA [Dactylosporangium matsuzakiense]